MGRQPDPNTPQSKHRGVTIFYYRRKSGRWKATYQLHGQARHESYGTTHAAAQRAAEAAIDRETNPEVYANRKEEDAARAILAGHNVMLTEVARHYVSEKDRIKKKASLEKVRSTWLESKSKDRFHHVRTLRNNTVLLAEKFGPQMIHLIRKAEIISWLESLRNDRNYSGRTVRNIYDSTKDLFRYAQNHESLDPERKTILDQIDRPRAAPAGKAIYHCEDMQSLLNTAWAMASPATVALALSSFAAIRSEELCSPDPARPMLERVAWEDFRWQENALFIRDNVGKGYRARPVPLSKILRQILQPLRGTGPIYPQKRLDLEYAKIAVAAKVKWKTNAPRHSAITYWMLLHSSPAEVANWAGNSVQTIDSNYRNRGATKAEAKTWFQLRPQTKWGSSKS